jgi:hypothetical protein
MNATLLQKEEQQKKNLALYNTLLDLQRENLHLRSQQRQTNAIDQNLIDETKRALSGINRRREKFRAKRTEVHRLEQENSALEDKIKAERERKERLTAELRDATAAAERASEWEEMARTSQRQLHEVQNPRTGPLSPQTQALVNQLQVELGRSSGSLEFDSSSQFQDLLGVKEVGGGNDSDGEIVVSDDSDNGDSDGKRVAGEKESRDSLRVSKSVLEDVEPAVMEAVFTKPADTDEQIYIRSDDDGGA